MCSGLAFSVNEYLTEVTAVMLMCFVHVCLCEGTFPCVVAIQLTLQLLGCGT